MTTRPTAEHEHPHKHDYQHGHPKAAAEMRDAATKFLASLKPEQKAKATFSFYDGERIFWYYPPMNRHGLRIKDMDAKQRQAAKALMATGLSADANQKANAIMEHEGILGPLEKEQGHITWDRDPLLYSWTIFGDPAGQDPWGWRVEGHHVSLHYTIWNERVVSATPFFFGANPAEVRKGPKQGLRILGARQDIALELMNSLDAGQKSKALIFDEAPADILTFNAARASLPKEQGLPSARMSGTQKEMLMALCTEYVTALRPDLASEKMDELKQGGMDKIHFAWGGPAEKFKPHYYRLHGGNFVVEYDNRQNGANHIHSVLRNVENDFANDAMRDHLLMYHIL
ncbi:MAG: DUF3500 domain-containing protein [Dehalococcoidia bacterium]|nr:DUF3500 domain-containing protein [Dehalococcoidia bacterium]MSQ16677.1 DUF3500 domain-containing protein [Dehalococcoidia bacterium]